MRTSDISHARLSEANLTLRDHLAAQRTVLANERTLLAYARTALTLLIGGLTFLQFFGHFAAQALGWCFVPAAAATAVAGLVRYKKIKSLLARIASVNPVPGEAPTQ